jgi:hypothetical protein
MLYIYLKEHNCYDCRHIVIAEHSAITSVSPAVAAPDLIQIAAVTVKAVNERTGTLVVYVQTTVLSAAASVSHDSQW